MITLDATLRVSVLGVASPRGAGLAGGVAAAALGLPLAYAGPTSAPAATVRLLQAEPSVRLLRVFGTPATVSSAVITRLRRS